MTFLYDHGPSIGLVFFFCVFLWVAYRAYRPSAKQEMQSYALIPLAKDTNHE